VPKSPEISVIKPKLKPALPSCPVVTEPQLNTISCPSVEQYEDGEILLCKKKGSELVCASYGTLTNQ